MQESLVVVSIFFLRMNLISIFILSMQRGAPKGFGQLDLRLVSTSRRLEALGYITRLTPKAPLNYTAVSTPSHIHSPLQSSSSAGTFGKRLLDKAPESDAKRYKSKDTDGSMQILFLLPSFD